MWTAKQLRWVMNRAKELRKLGYGKGAAMAQAWAELKASLGVR